MAFQSKARYYQEGEHNTKYFFGLAKSNYANKVMTSVIDDAGVRHEQPMKILDVLHRYYKKLYKANSSTKFSLTNVGNNKITVEDRCFLDSPLNIDELKEAAFHFKPDKTPGVDGFVAAFYQEFWDVISVNLFESLMEAKAVGKLHVSARRGVTFAHSKEG